MPPTESLAELVVAARRRMNASVARYLDRYQRLNADGRGALPYGVTARRDRPFCVQLTQDEVVVGELERINGGWRVEWLASPVVLTEIERHL